MAGHPTDYAGPWNLDPESRSLISVQELVELVLKEWGSGAWETAAIQNQPHEAGLLALDISKAHYALGWTPTQAVDQAIKGTVDWYREYKVNPRMYDFCRDQIEGYVKLMRVLDAGPAAD
jgi:CDP-glucose 4,6-dehydratase